MNTSLVLLTVSLAVVPAAAPTLRSGREREARRVVVQPAPETHSAGAFEPGARLVSSPTDIHPGVGLPGDLLRPEPRVLTAGGAVALLVPPDSEPKGKPLGFRTMLHVEPTPGRGTKGPSLMKMLDQSLADPSVLEDQTPLNENGDLR